MPLPDLKRRQAQRSCRCRSRLAGGCGINHSPSCRPSTGQRVGAVGFRLSNESINRNAECRVLASPPPCRIEAWADEQRSKRRMAVD